MIQSPVSDQESGVVIAWAVTWPGRSERKPVIKDAEITAPACSTSITIRPGFPVRVMVTHDFVLEPYHG